MILFSSFDTLSLILRALFSLLRRHATYDVYILMITPLIARHAAFRFITMIDKIYFDTLMPLIITLPLLFLLRRWLRHFIFIFLLRYSRCFYAIIAFHYYMYCLLRYYFIIITMFIFAITPMIFIAPLYYWYFDCYSCAEAADYADYAFHFFIISAALLFFFFFITLWLLLYFSLMPLNAIFAVSPRDFLLISDVFFLRVTELSLSLSLWHYLWLLSFSFSSMRCWYALFTGGLIFVIFVAFTARYDMMLPPFFTTLFAILQRADITLPLPPLRLHFDGACFRHAWYIIYYFRVST